MISGTLTDATLPVATSTSSVGAAFPSRRRFRLVAVGLEGEKCFEDVADFLLNFFMRMFAETFLLNFFCFFVFVFFLKKTLYRNQNMEKFRP